MVGPYDLTPLISYSCPFLHPFLSLASLLRRAAIHPLLLSHAYELDAYCQLTACFEAVFNEYIDHSWYNHI